MLEGSQGQPTIIQAPLFWLYGALDVLLLTHANVDQNPPPRLANGLPQAYTVAATTQRPTFTFPANIAYPINPTRAPCTDLPVLSLPLPLRHWVLRYLGHDLTRHPYGLPVDNLGYPIFKYDEQFNYTDVGYGPGVRIAHPAVWEEAQRVLEVYAAAATRGMQQERGSP